MPEKISILIVDDEDSVRDSLYNWFIEDGYEVECAENAKQALSILESRNLLTNPEIWSVNTNCCSLSACSAPI